MKAQHRRAGAFTIVEMLVVVSLIAVLASMLLPAIGRVRDMGMGIRCQGNLRTLMGGFLAFAADHNQCLPGANLTPNGAAYQQDWLMPSFDPSTAPQTGTIYPYINNKQAYLCPAMDTDKGAYAQSNGRFDYGFFCIFNGTPIRSIKQQSTLQLLTGGVGWYPTPILCQEDGYRENGTNPEGDHSNVDQMSHMHNGGSYYAAIDGSVNWANEPDVYGAYSNGCWQWATEGPASHSMVSLGKPYDHWASWLQY